MKSSLKIIFFLLIFFHLGSAVWAQEQIQSFDSQIIINQDGTINVEERIVYDFSNLERHGIYRDIPYIKKNEAGKKFRLDFTSVSVRDEDGNSYQFKKTAENGKLRLKVGDPNKTITGVYTYIIRFQVSGALTYFSDHDELYWNVTGNDWTVPIAQFTSGVGLPIEIGQSDISAICYTGYEASTAKNCAYEIKDSLVNFQSQNELNPREGLTIVVKFPKNIVSVLEPKPYVTFWETFLGKFVLGLLIVAAFTWYVVYPIKIPLKWLREGRDPQTHGTGSARAWFEPPKTREGRALTPEETGALVDERADMEDVSGMIVYLAQKGYLKIEERQKGHFYFKKRKEFAADENLLSFERTFLAELFEKSDEFRIQKSKLYDAVENVKTSIYKKLVSERFFPENPNKVRSFYTLIGGFALATLNIALAFSAFFFGRNMPRKTVLGVEATNIAKSLRNFLSSQERQLEFQAKNQMMFEKLLPYAIVFGVEKIWAERFKDLDLKPPDWYSGYGTTRFNSVYFTNSLNSSFSSLRSAATPTSSSSGFSSGFSGGSSGGGGGGGGGGSW